MSVGIAGRSGDWAAGEALRLTSGRASLHVDDLVVANRQNLIPLGSLAAVVEPGGRADDPVVAHQCELRSNLRCAAATLLDLELQDLTGLFGPASARCPFPPEVTARNASPLGVIGEE